LHYLQQNFIARVSICIFTGAKVMILNRKFLKFEIDLDFVLIAVTTSLKDYRICYLINKFLTYNFVKAPDLSVEVRPGEEPILFSLYHFKSDENGTDSYFIANKGTDGYLVPEMKKAGGGSIKHLRMAGGEVWEDMTMDEWDPSELAQYT